MQKLRARTGNGARALEFTILTIARSGETRGAAPEEIAKGQAVWTVPEGRIKGEKQHRVPLSQRALEVLELVDRPSKSDIQYLFPGFKKGRPLSDGTLLALLERMGYGHVTVHGFRSTFRDWAAERTNVAREVAEMALAHVVADDTEGAYWRSDLFEKRRRLMEQWEAFCMSPPSADKDKIVSLKSRKRA